MDKAIQRSTGAAWASHGGNQGLNLSADGLRLGPIGLVLRTASGYRPRALAELNFVLSGAFGRPVTAASVEPCLKAMASALDAHDRQGATAAFELLRLPILTQAEADRAEVLERFSKAGVDDPVHPGWPAGSPNGEGGQFRPKDETDINDLGAEREALEAVRRRLEQAVTRKALKEGLKLALKPTRIGREAAELLSNLVPGLDVLGDAALAADVAQTVGESVSVLKDARVALDFIKQGPRALEALTLPGENRVFDSFSALKKIDPAAPDQLIKFYGKPPDGYEYHHIVEQVGSGLAREAVREINSTRNIVVIPKMLHEEVSGYASRISKSTVERVTNRVRISRGDFEKQYQDGVEALRELHIVK